MRRPAMIRIRNRTVIAAIACAMATVLALALPASARYGEATVEDVGLLPDDHNSIAKGVNESGVVVGDSSSSFARAFRWDPAVGSPEYLGSLGVGHSEANAINDHGVIVGRSAIALPISSFDTNRAFRWDPSTGVMTQLDGLGGYSAANAVNDNGWIVGRALDGAPIESRAALWKPGEAVQIIPGLDASNRAVAMAVNDSNVVVGIASTDDGPRLFRWTEGGGTEDLGPVSVVFGMNDAGQILYLEDFGDELLAIREPGGTITPVPEPEGFEGWATAAINEDGSVAASYASGPEVLGFVWDPPSGTMVSLPSLGGTFAEVYGFDAGVVVGMSSYDDESFLATRWVLAPLAPGPSESPDADDPASPGNVAPVGPAGTSPASAARPVSAAPNLTG